MSSDKHRELNENRLSLELYKELGLEARQRSLETYPTNRLMLPPLVIGLLVLYGEVETFLGVKFNNPEAMHRLVWFGCVVISLIWICNMSRLSQLSQWHLKIQRVCEHKLGLIGHRKIAKMDKKRGEDLPASKILRHSRLRFFGFAIYFFLLLFKIESLNFHGVLSFLNSIEGVIPWAIFLVIIFAVSVFVPFYIYYLYLKAPLCSLRATPTELRDTQKRKFIDTNKEEVQASTMIRILKIFSYIIFPSFLMLSILMVVDMQQRPDVNAHLERGLKYSAKGDYADAIECFNKVIALESNSAGAYFNRGSAYYNKGDFARAIIDFDKVIALDSNNSDAREVRKKAQKELENSDNQ